MDALQELHDELYRAQRTESVEVLMDSIGKARLLLARYRESTASRNEAAVALQGLHGFLLSCAAKADSTHDAQVIRNWAREVNALAAPGAAIDAREQEARDSQVITLCGSARFERLFKAWNEALTMAGHTIFSLTAYPSDKDGVKQWYTDEQKVALDAAHFRKIAASDAIFVLNLHAYIGESTLREIEYARELGKTIYFLESWGKGFGIGGAHTDEAQRSAIADGLTLPTASPIDTTTRSGARNPWATHLLGPAGALRSAIVEMTNQAARAALASREEAPAASAQEIQHLCNELANIARTASRGGLHAAITKRVLKTISPAASSEALSPATVAQPVDAVEKLDAVLRSSDTTDAHRCEIIDRFRAALSTAKSGGGATPEGGGE